MPRMTRTSTITFFKELENQLEDFAQENIIIVGDFNCALSENDKKGGKSSLEKIHSN